MSDLKLSSLVFVYGTLKEGQSNHGLLAHTQRIGMEAHTYIPYTLSDNGSFPYMSFGRDRRQVSGEVYYVDTDEDLMYLDALEGVDFGHYERQLIPIAVNYGSKWVMENCWAYITSTERGAEYPLCPVDGELYEWEK